jgi:hypothetical protein
MHDAECSESIGRILVPVMGAVRVIISPATQGLLVCLRHLPACSHGWAVDRSRQNPPWLQHGIDASDDAISSSASDQHHLNPRPVRRSSNFLISLVCLLQPFRPESAWLFCQQPVLLLQSGRNSEEIRVTCKFSWVCVPIDR